ncbi:MAG: Hint domain-containing protein [Rhodobacter sp.]|nr:Hint domain-containing protein [Rhodobacter sp.]
MADFYYGSEDGGAADAARLPGSAPILGYASGTFIDTPAGARPVEAIVAGDRVETLDHGGMAVRWVHTETLDLRRARIEARPVLIQAGAFGPGRPARDLVVGPQHRILVGALGQIDGAFGGQAFATARALTRLPRIRPMFGRDAIRWVHIFLDRHEVVCANGLYAETLSLCPAGIAALRPFRRGRLVQAFAPGPVPIGPLARDSLGTEDVWAELAHRRSLGGLAKVA